MTRLAMVEEEAGIGSRRGPAALIRSDGSQDLRPMVEADRIAVHILNWYGGTNAGLGEWVGNYGQGRLVRKGEQMQFLLRLRLVAALAERARR